MKPGMPLVRIKGGPPRLPELEIALDPHLAILSQSELALRYAHDFDGFLAYLGHRILQRPGDIKSHVQCILLLIQHADGALLYGALVDLFIALGDKGQALKQRMLELAAPQLNRTSQVFLQRHVADGVNACDAAIERVRSALLRAATCGGEPLVRRHSTAEGAQEQSPLQEAQEFIQHGQLELALDTLERALLDDPNQEEIAGELFDLYQRMGATERMEAMRVQLQERGRIPPSWDRASQ